MFRAIPVTNCADCHHSQDWSSQGLECNKSDPPRTIERGYAYEKEARDRGQTTTPAWCPLPMVDYTK